MTRAALMALSLLTALAGLAAAAPPGPAPKVAGVSDGPPPAWIEAGAVEKWLAYSSYCWKTTCVDFVPPSMRKDIPVLTIKRGRLVKIHLRFAPAALSVTQGTKTTRLVAARVAAWRPGAGLATFFARPKSGGDASYVIRVRLR